MARGSPRRDALEYGMLLFCTTGLSAGLGLMLYMRNSPGGLEKLDLDSTVDFKGAWRELKQLRDRAIGGDGGGDGIGGVKSGSNPDPSADEKK